MSSKNIDFLKGKSKISKNKFAKENPQPDLNCILQKQWDRGAGAEPDILSHYVKLPDRLCY